MYLLISFGKKKQKAGLKEKTQLRFWLLYSSSLLFKRLTCVVKRINPKIIIKQPTIGCKLLGKFNFSLSQNKRSDPKKQKAKKFNKLITRRNRSLSDFFLKFCMKFEIIYSADWIEIGNEYNTLTFLPFCSPGFHLGQDFKTLMASFPVP